MPRKFLIIASLLALTALAGCGEKGTLSFTPCADLDPAGASACISDAVNNALEKDSDSAHLFKTVDRLANNSGGQVSALCHGAMHPVGRSFARKNKVTLDNLQNYLPQSDGPNCSDGFVHGMFMALDVDVSDSQAMLETCSRRSTRTRQYACIHGIGHAFRRTFLKETNLSSTLDACKGLGQESALECAAGAYHDYFLAAGGLEDTPRPRGPAVVDYCKSQPDDFLAQCWYRLFQGLKIDNPPDKANYINYLCGGGGLKESQRRACVTGAAAKIIAPDQVVKTCSQVKERTACLESGEKLSWSSLVSTRYITDDKSLSLARREKDFSTLLGQCSLFKNESDRCAYLVGLLSIRLLPDKIDPVSARSVCQGLSDEEKISCRRGIEQAGKRLFN